MYKGNYVCTITEAMTKPNYSLDLTIPRDKRAEYLKIRDVLGRILPGDVDKQVWKVGEVYYVESDQQKITRLSK